MAMTPKQDRNGGPGPEGDRVTGPSNDMTNEIRSTMKAAQNAGIRRADEGRRLFDSPAGSGVDGHEVGGGGNMYEWDSSLAVREQTGES
jgi:hypothetical protein